MGQIQKREVYDVPLNEKLPTAFYYDLIEKFEGKAKIYIDQIAMLERDMKAILDAKSKPKDLSAKEGILQILRNHQGAIERLSSAVQRVHREIEGIKVHCIAVYGLKSDVFEQDEKLEALCRRKKENQLREALAASKPAQQPAQITSGQTPTTQATTTIGQGTFTGGSGGVSGNTGVGSNVNTSSQLGVSTTAPSIGISFGQPSSSTALTTTFNPPFPSTASGSFGSFGPLTMGGSLSSMNSTSMPSLTGGTESLVQAKMNRKKGSLSRKY